MKELLGTVVIWHCANLAKLRVFSRSFFSVWLLARTGHMRSLPEIWRAAVRWEPLNLYSRCRVPGATHICCHCCWQQPLGGGAAAGLWAPPAPTISLSAFWVLGQGPGSGLFWGERLRSGHPHNQGAEWWETNHTGSSLSQVFPCSP